MPKSLLDVMQSRLDIHEIRGTKNNAVIVGWFKDVGHPEVVDDETSYCSASLGSAAIECGIPTPPHNIVLMARSWMTWGTKVEKDPAHIQPGDVAIWPRGDPRGWQGHVNVVESIEGDTVVCIGANQRVPGKSYDGVTRSAPRLISEALGFRRAVPATVEALRKAGSSEVKKADRIQNGGWIVTAIPAAVATAKELLEPVQVPSGMSLPETLTWWETTLRGINAVGSLFLNHPWLAGTAVLGILCVLAGRQFKNARLAKHQAGVPLSSQVAAVGG